MRILLLCLLFHIRCLEKGLILFSSYNKWLVFYMGQYLYEPDFHNALYLKFIGTHFRPSKTAAFITIACITAKKGTLL